MDRRFLINTAAALLGGLAIGTVQATNVAPATFAQLDTNGDGYISQSEAQAAAHGTTDLGDPDEFAKADTNKDGKINATEYAAYLAAHTHPHPSTTTPTP